MNKLTMLNPSYQLNSMINSFYRNQAGLNTCETKRNQHQDVLFITEGPSRSIITNGILRVDKLNGNATLGSPKGRKTHGDGVIIVPAFFKR